MTLLGLFCDLELMLKKASLKNQEQTLDPEKNKTLQNMPSGNSTEVWFQIHGEFLTEFQLRRFAVSGHEPMLFVQVGGGGCPPTMSLGDMMPIF